MPQIAQIAETYASQIFWLLVTFGFVFFVIGLDMVPKIEATVGARDDKIAGDLATAKAAFARADEIEADYRKRDADARSSAQHLIAESKAKAAKETEAKIKATDAVVATKIAAAEAEIKAASTSAMAEIEAVAADAAREMVAKISGASVTPEAAQQAVKAALVHG
ncbi:MAG: ATPase [Sphingobium sp.]|uniref:F0F1 ATP synthase subunit B family protein n=1 Tax=Sphingobium sp. CECT 9361 TaxID=2845384 RepID=UPI001E60D8E3|nr:ATPase [Sphingobium sp. CECT 9361]CAH0353420.1 ATP synthase subunit b' [Sphingobium sp. CECT 9361]